MDASVDAQPVAGCRRRSLPTLDVYVASAVFDLVRVQTTLVKDNDVRNVACDDYFATISTVASAENLRDRRGGVRATAHEDRDKSGDGE